MLKKTTCIALLAMSCSIFNYLVVTPVSMTIALEDETIVPYSADGTSPRMVEGSLKVDRKKAVPGDVVTVSLKATDDLSGVESVSLLYTMPSGTSQSARMTYAYAADEYICEFDIDDHSQNGDWKISAVAIRDHHENEKKYETVYDLSSGTFAVYNPVSDVTAPQMVEGSLMVDQNDAVPGDTVTLSLKATDDLSGVNSVFVHYKTENGMSEADFMTYDSDTDEYIGEFYIDSNSQQGKWKVSAISISDNNGNNTYYCTSDFMTYESATEVYICKFSVDSDSQHEEWKISAIPISDNYGSHTPYKVTGCDLSSGSFEVMDISLAENRIDAEYVLTDTTWANKTVDADVYIGPDAILTIIDDVKINGNLYVLGGMICYGCLTCEKIFGKSFLWGEHSRFDHGTVNFRNGPHSISGMTTSDFPIPSIPIEIYSSPVVDADGNLTLLEGATVPVADFYIDGVKREYLENGTFRIDNYHVGTRHEIEFWMIDVFGNVNSLKYPLDDYYAKIRPCRN